VARQCAGQSFPSYMGGVGLPAGDTLADGYVRKSLNLRDRRDEAARVWAAGALS